MSAPTHITHIGLLQAIYKRKNKYFCYNPMPKVKKINDKYLTDKKRYKIPEEVIG